jgi:V/A-type H+-transporting ATPase subunit K
MDRMKLAKVVAVASILMVVVAATLGMLLSAAFGAEAGEGAPAQAKPPASGWVAMAIAICIGSGTLGAGIAVGRVGSAAIGAASERPEIMGRALVFVVIAEGIAVWGLVGAILLVGRL